MNNFRPPAPQFMSGGGRFPLQQFPGPGPRLPGSEPFPPFHGNQGPLGNRMRSPNEGAPMLRGQAAAGAVPVRMLQPFGGGNANDDVRRDKNRKNWKGRVRGNRKRQTYKPHVVPNKNQAQQADDLLADHLRLDDGTELCELSQLDEEKLLASDNESESASNLDVKHNSDPNLNLSFQPRPEEKRQSQHPYQRQQKSDHTPLSSQRGGNNFNQGRRDSADRNRNRGNAYNVSHSSNDMQSRPGFQHPSTHFNQHAPPAGAPPTSAMEFPFPQRSVIAPSPAAPPPFHPGMDGFSRGQLPHPTPPDAMHPFGMHELDFRQRPALPGDVMPPDMMLPQFAGGHPLDQHNPRFLLHGEPPLPGFLPHELARQLELGAPHPGMPAPDPMLHGLNPYLPSSGALANVPQHPPADHRPGFHDNAPLPHPLQDNRPPMNHPMGHMPLPRDLDPSLRMPYPPNDHSKGGPGMPEQFDPVLLERTRLELAMFDEARRHHLNDMLRFPGPSQVHGGPGVAPAPDQHTLLPPGSVHQPRPSLQPPQPPPPTGPLLHDGMKGDHGMLLGGMVMPMAPAAGDYLGAAASLDSAVASLTAGHQQIEYEKQLFEATMQRHEQQQQQRLQLAQQQQLQERNQQSLHFGETSYEAANAVLHKGRQHFFGVSNKKADSQSRSRSWSRTRSRSRSRSDSRSRSWTRSLSRSRTRSYSPAGRVVSRQPSRRSQTPPRVVRPMMYSDDRLQDSERRPASPLSHRYRDSRGSVDGALDPLRHPKKELTRRVGNSQVREELMATAAAWSRSSYPIQQSMPIVKMKERHQEQRRQSSRERRIEQGGEASRESESSRGRHAEQKRALSRDRQPVQGSESSRLPKSREREARDSKKRLSDRTGGSTRHTERNRREGSSPGKRAVVTSTSRGRQASDIKRERSPSRTSFSSERSGDKSNRRLMVGSLASSTTERKLRSLFACFGGVESVKVSSSRHKALVSFVKREQALACRRQFHRALVDNSHITVDFV